MEGSFGRGREWRAEPGGERGVVGAHELGRRKRRQPEGMVRWRLGGFWVWAGASLSAAEGSGSSVRRAARARSGDAGREVRPPERGY